MLVDRPLAGGTRSLLARMDEAPGTVPGEGHEGDGEDGDDRKPEAHDSYLMLGYCIVARRRGLGFSGCSRTHKA